MNVLLISANHEPIDLLALALALRGHKLTHVADEGSARSQLRDRRYNLIIIDGEADHDTEQVRMCRQIRSLQPVRHAAIWIIADSGSPDHIVMAIDACATGFLSEPFSAQQLRSQLESVEAYDAFVTGMTHSNLESEQFLDALLDAVAIVDLTGQIRYASSRFESLLGFEQAMLADENIESLCHLDDFMTLLHGIRSAGEHPDTTPSFDIRLLRMDREWQAVEVRICDLRQFSSINGIMVRIRDNSERALREQQLKRQAFFDPLAGLANRTLFVEHLAQSLARSERFNRPTAVMYLDINAFKRINDVFGNLVGDAVLIHVAEQIRSSIRSNDIAARLGGDEFVVLVGDFTSEDDVQMIARRIESAVETPLHVEGHTIITTISVGSAFSTPGMLYTADILRDADRALYGAKARRTRGTGMRQVTESLRPSVDIQDVSILHAGGAVTMATGTPSPSSVRDSRLVPGQVIHSQSGETFPIVNETSDEEMSVHDQPTLEATRNFCQSPNLIDRFVELEAHIEKLLDGGTETATQ